MNCQRYQASMEGSSAEVFEQICFVILDICQRNQNAAFDGRRDEGLEKLFGLTQPVFASIQHTCSGGLEQSAHATSLFMVSDSTHYHCFCVEIIYHRFAESFFCAWRCTLDEKFGSWNYL
jgi:hypothetical protein